MLSFPVAPDVDQHSKEYVTAFSTSQPVRHVVIDGFLDPDFAQQLEADLPDPTSMPKSRDYAGPVNRILAKNWNRFVLVKNKFFGSGTLKNRR